jgi:hypothetical protein
LRRFLKTVPARSQAIRGDMFEAKGDRNSCLFGQEPQRYLDDRSSNVYIDERNGSMMEELLYSGSGAVLPGYVGDGWIH